MKKLLSIIAFAVTSLFYVEQAAAQTPNVYTVGAFSGLTSAVNASTTATPGNTFSVSEFENAGIQITLKASTTNTTLVTFNFAKSVDSTTYESTPSVAITVTPNGVTEVSKFTNVSVSGVAGLKLVSIENSNANGYITNIAVKYRLKAAKVLSR